MIDLSTDVAIIGSGFGGSLTALLLERIGMTSVLIDRGTHPRVVLGESSTPVADLVLQSLTAKYDLPRIAPLSKWGPWQRAYPWMTCGLKRGFSYVKHVAHEPFQPRADHLNELHVAASNNDEDADTHWYRPEFDAFLVEEAQAAGIPFLDRTTILQLEGDGPWLLRGERAGEPVQIRAGFLLDASGEGQFIARSRHIPNAPDGMRTHSRCLWGHFTGVARWQDQYCATGGLADHHPYPCDASALHHIIEGGWMFVLPFNNGVTSAGFLLDTRQYPLDSNVSPEEEWAQLLRRYPAIGEQFARTELTSLCGPLRRTPRLQRRARQMVGPGWAMFPLTAYALDALNSTGNAHTLTGIERLIPIFERRLPPGEQLEALRDYERIVNSEIDLLDEFVAGCYSAFRHFPLFASFVMFYFAGATFSESNRRHGRHRPEHGFLLAHDQHFRSALTQAGDALRRLDDRPTLTDAEITGFEDYVGELIQPFNLAGLCDPARHNMYPFLELPLGD